MKTAIIETKDRNKSARCNVTLALCGQYSVTVEPSFTGNGVLALFDDIVLPRIWPFDPSSVWAAPNAEDSKMLCYATLTNGAGTLDLRVQKLVERISKTHAVGDVAQIYFEVYSDNAGGLLGAGTLNILVTEISSTAEDQGTLLFKGEQGETGRGISKLELDHRDGDGNNIYKVTYSDGTTSELIVPRGERGISPQIGWLKGDDNLWYQATVKAELDIDGRPTGEKIISVNKEGVEYPSEFLEFVTLLGEQTIDGTKTFTGSPIVPTPTDEDESTKAANTSWVKSFVSAWWTRTWNALKNTAISWTQKHAFTAGIEGNVTGNVTGNLTGNVTGNVTGDVTGSLDATGDGKTVLVPMASESDDSNNAASTKWVKGLVNSISRRASGYVHFNVFNSPTSEPNTNSVYTATISNLIPGETYKVYADFVALANSTNVAYNYYGSSLKFEFNPHDGEDADLTWQTSFRKFGVHVSDEKMLVRVDGTIYDADGKYAESVLGNKVVADENGEINVKFTRVPFAQQVYHFTLMNSMTITAELAEPDEEEEEQQ